MILIRRTLMSRRLMPCLISNFKRGVESSSGVATGVDANIPADLKFQTVFALPQIRHIALFNRLKVYTAAGTVAAVPICGVLVATSVVPLEITAVASYIGITSTVLLSVVSLLTRNIIGFLYISDDDEYIKISTVDYWGLRRNKVVPVSDWVPLNELPLRRTDPFYLSPRLESDPIPMKLIMRMGKVFNKEKVGRLLE